MLAKTFLTAIFTSLILAAFFITGCAQQTVQPEHIVRSESQSDIVAIYAPRGPTDKVMSMGVSYCQQQEKVIDWSHNYGDGKIYKYKCVDEKVRERVVDDQVKALQATPEQNYSKMAEEINRHFSTCIAKVRAQRPYSYTDAARCTDDTDILRKYKQPDIDIWELRYKKNYVVAERLNRHEITETEAQAILSEIAVDMNDRLARRAHDREQDEREFSRDLEQSRHNLNEEMLLLGMQQPQQTYSPPGPIQCTSTTLFGTTNTNCY